MSHNVSSSMIICNLRFKFSIQSYLKYLQFIHDKDLVTFWNKSHNYVLFIELSRQVSNALEEAVDQSWPQSVCVEPIRPQDTARQLCVLGVSSASAHWAWCVSHSDFCKHPF